MYEISYIFSDPEESESKVFFQILECLELTDKFPSKISIKDIITVDPNEWNEQQKENKCLADIPRLVLKRLICSHSESRDITVTDEHSLNFNFGLANAMSSIIEVSNTKEDISPLDTLFVIFQCCDPFLRQVIVQKLYLCKIAVPFLYKYWGNGSRPSSMLSVWPLRLLAIENKPISNSDNKGNCEEIGIIDLPTKMIAFGRFGRPRYSKSKLINNLLTSNGGNTFFNIDCPSGMSTRKVSNGLIEMFWLPTVDEKKDKFQDAMTFLNLRGVITDHFDADTLTFVANFTDAIAIIVDVDTIINQGISMKNIILNFSSVILIIANPLNPENTHFIDSFQKDILECKTGDISLRVLSTHKGAVEQNVVDMVSIMTKCISNQLKSNCPKSYQERFEQAKVAQSKTDEQDNDCQTGKKESENMIKQMKSACRPSEWKLHLTPVQSIYSKKLGQLMKDRQREKCFESGNTIDAEIKRVRTDQTKAVTETIKLFINILLTHEGSPLTLKYFLSWLHIDIEKEKRNTLPLLMLENRQAWQKLKYLKSIETQDQSKIEKQEKVITQLEEKIDKSSFSVQHFFREIGHINEAFLALGKDCHAFDLPPLSQIANIVGRLVVDGYQLELIDGESFYMPYKWIKSVGKEVKKIIKSGKVLALSVLGLQSSGKSTLLNTMFGCQFSTKTGRCTRGIHVQLVPAYTAKITNKLSDYEYVLVVDTEGLRSPELSHFQQEHDNELATVITGIGDITIINIMGENTSEIRDILQVIVHAFLRLKMTNKDLDMRKSCSFVHQNVADSSASQNMISGLSKTIQSLDEMTKESARSEGIMNITTFNQVIEFDINSQVWYVKNLWQGNPPMAKVNTEYSETVVEIKSSVLQKALTMEKKSYKCIDDIVEQAHNLWKGVLNEDFVFSFRNSIEIKAYMAMEHAIRKELWCLESIIREKLVHISQNGFADCTKKEHLLHVASKLNSDLHDVLLDEKDKRVNEMNEYFKNDKYRDIIIQWKTSQQCRFDLLCHKLEISIKEQIDKSSNKRSVEILTDNCHEEHEEELRVMSMEVANKYKGQKLSNEKIDELFNNIWLSFVTKMNTSFSNSENNKRKMSEIFLTCLKNIFKENNAVLKDVLAKKGSLTPLEGLQRLNGSFELTGIDKKDINFTWFQTAKSIFTGTKDIMTYVKNRVNQIFESTDETIKQFCQVREEITDLEVNQMIHDLGSHIDDILKDRDVRFQKPFYIKIIVHVSRHAQAVFETHNENYFKCHGAAARLEKYRVQQKISFEAHLNCRLSEDTVSKLFINIIESFAEEWILQTISNEVCEALHSHLPSLKNRVIIEICTDLLEKDQSENMKDLDKSKVVELQKENFDRFTKYINLPKEYASSWITHKANEFLFSTKSKSYYQISTHLVKNIFMAVKKCFCDTLEEHDMKSPIPTDKWTDYFRNLLGKSGFSISIESFRSVNKETKTIENLQYLTNKILECLITSEEEILSRFKEKNSDSVQWADTNPIDRVIQKIWGCPEQCAFCGEPCAKDKNHDGSDHFSLQHRPLCSIGISKVESELAVMESCAFKIQSEATHSCGIFNYICNNGQKEKCKTEFHRYRDYRVYLKQWHIAPTSNMLESSKFWMWFVATYKDSLQQYNGYKLENLPPSWMDITKTQALDSLKEIYST